MQDERDRLIACIPRLRRYARALIGDRAGTDDLVQNKDTGFRFAQQGKVNVFYWIDGKFGYALSAGIDRGELTRIAYAVYDQLDTRPQ